MWWLFQGRTEIPLHQKNVPRNIRFPSPWLYFMLLFLGSTPQNNIFCPNWKCVGSVVICGNTNSKWIFDSLLELQVLVILKFCFQRYDKIAAILLFCSELREKRKWWQSLVVRKQAKVVSSVVGSHGSLHKCDRGGRPLGLGSCSRCHGKALSFIWANVSIL